MQYKNLTPFPAQMWEFTDHNNTTCISALVRVKFKFQHDCSSDTFALAIDQHQDDLQVEDIYYDDGIEIRYPKDIVPYKPFTDLIINACSYPPVPKITAWKSSVCVYDEEDNLIHEKSLLIQGKRKLTKRLFFREWELSKVHEPIESISLRYTNSYGGEVHHSPSNGQAESILLDRYEANPIGKGLTHPESKIKELDAPEIEHLSRSKNGSQYAGFGAIKGSWEDRYKHCGTYDDAWIDQKYPVLPDDFNPEYYQMAHPDMIIKTQIDSACAIRLENIHPEHSEILVKIPYMNFIARTSSNTAVKEMPLKIDTILVDGNSTNINDWCIFVSWRNYHRVEEVLNDENMLYLIK